MEAIPYRTLGRTGEKVSIVGLGGAGSKLAIQAKETLNSDCLVISNDQKDLQGDCQKIAVST